MKEGKLDIAGNIIAIIGFILIFLFGANVIYHKLFKKQEIMGIVVEKVNVRHDQKLLIIQAGDYAFEEWVGLKEYINYNVGDKLMLEYYQPIWSEKVFSIKQEEIRKAKIP